MTHKSQRQSSKLMRTYLFYAQVAEFGRIKFELETKVRAQMSSTFDDHDVLVDRTRIQ